MRTLKLTFVVFAAACVAFLVGCNPGGDKTSSQPSPSAAAQPAPASGSDSSPPSQPNAAQSEPASQSANGQTAGSETPDAAGQPDVK